MNISASNLTVVVLTRNEERNLLRCLKAIPNRYRAVVLDSGSNDRTLEIAHEHGCAVYHNDWAGFTSQRNFALEKCEITTRWVLFVDADEVYPLSFYQWFEAEVARSAAIDVVMVPSYLFMYGQRLEHAPGYPIYHPRLVRRETVRFVTNHTRHGESVPEGCLVIKAAISYDHYFYEGDLVEWMHKHIGKAVQEAYVKPTHGAMLTRRGRISVYFGHSILRMPARFLYHYVVCRGFRDGFRGLEFSLMFAWYEGTKYVLAKTGRAKSSV
jgi:glycosyltransferase involved in cell wall biosynthesis